MPVVIKKPIKKVKPDFEVGLLPSGHLVPKTGDAAAQVSLITDIVDKFLPGNSLGVNAAFEQVSSFIEKGIKQLIEESDSPKKAIEQIAGFSKKPLNASVFEKHKDNWYAEEPWTSKALFRDVEFVASYNGKPSVIHDPFCGVGAVPEAAVEAGYEHVIGWDIKDRRLPYQKTNSKWDFLAVDSMKECALFSGPVCSIVSNPPYDLIDDLFDMMLDASLDGLFEARAALFMPLQYLSGKAKRLRKLPLSHVLVLTPRPNCLPGELILAGEKPGGGRRDFAWYIFTPLANNLQPFIGWMPKDAALSSAVATGKW